MKINWQWVARATLALAGAGPVLASTDGPLHVPSPDWRDQVIYFVLTDRFDACTWVRLPTSSACHGSCMTWAYGISIAVSARCPRKPAVQTSAAATAPETA